MRKVVLYILAILMLFAIPAALQAQHYPPEAFMRWL